MSNIFNNNKFDMISKHLPYGLLYDFRPKNELLAGELTDTQIIKNIKLIENFNERGFISSIKGLNEVDFIKEVNKHYLYFEQNHKDKPYLTNNWLSKTKDLIMNEREIKPEDKELFNMYFHEKHFPKDNNLKNWGDVKYYYSNYLNNIEINIDSIDYINKLSDDFFNGEIYNICHRAWVEIEKGISNNSINTVTIENDLKKLSNRHYALIEKYKLNHADKMPSYRAFFDTMQYLYDHLINLFDEINSQPLQSIKEPKSIESNEPENPYPTIFVNGYAYQMFLKLKELTVKKVTELADYAFIFHSMKTEKFIDKDTKHKKFIEFLNDNHSTDISAIKFTFKKQDYKEPTYSSILNQYKPLILSVPKKVQ